MKITPLFAPAALLALTAATPFDAEAGPLKKCNVSIVAQPNAQDSDGYWKSKTRIENAAIASGVDLHVITYPASGESSVYIVRDREHGDKLPLSELSRLGETAIAECQGNNAAPVAQPVNQPQ